MSSGNSPSASTAGGTGDMGAANASAAGAATPFSPVETIELVPAHLPLPPPRAPPPPPPPRVDDEAASLLSSSRALYSSPMRPSQYVPRPTTSAADPAVDRADEERRRRRVAERVSLEQALLRRRWQAHSVSALFHFRRDCLSAYAHDLVKALRATALRASGQQFGYSVSIRSAGIAAVVFLIREDRRARRTSVASRAPQEREDVADARAAAFVLHFPTEHERRRPRRGREEQHVLLLNGNEELLAWSCSWLQRSFQCVVDTRPVRISELNLRRLARNLAISSLTERRPEPEAPQEQTPGEREDEDEDENEDEDERRKGQQPHAPLVLEFCSPDPRAPMQTYALTVPWEALRRALDKAGGASPGAVPEIVEMVEREYFDSLPFDLSVFELARFEMQEVAMSCSGDIEIFDLALLPAVLFSLYELLAVQDAPGPRRPTATF